MTKIALLGAGGKMGVRLSRNLANADFDVDHVEISEEGRRRLKDAVGVDSTVVRGRVTRLDGQDTGERPGRVLRGR